MRVRRPFAVVAASILASGCSGPTGGGGATGAAGASAAGGALGSAGATAAAGTHASAGTGGAAAGTSGVAGTVGEAGRGTAGTPASAGVGGAAGSTSGGGTSGLAGTSSSAGSGAGGSDGAGGIGGLGGAGELGGAGGLGGVSCGTSNGGGAGAALALPRFSFFVTSLSAMRTLSGSQDGFGGDLRFGEVGPGAGLRGADKICATIAEASMPGSAAKGWRAFLSATSDGCGGGVVNAIDRVGNGPWYDRLGRLIAADRAALVNERPEGADTLVIDDLPNEDGIPNHTDGQPGCVRDQCPDNHDTLTGSSASGTLWNPSPAQTCNDWTSAAGTTGRPMVGHSWPASSGTSWVEAHTAQGCAPGVHLSPGTLPTTGMTVGYGGGYGGIYCFALTP